MSYILIVVIVFVLLVGGVVAVVFLTMPKAETKDEGTFQVEETMEGPFEEGEAAPTEVQCNYTEDWTAWGECKDGQQTRTRPYEGDETCDFKQTQSCETHDKITFKIKADREGSAINVWTIDVDDKKTQIGGDIQIGAVEKEHDFKVLKTDPKIKQVLFTIVRDGDKYQVSDVLYNDRSVYGSFETRGGSTDPKNITSRHKWRNEYTPLYIFGDRGRWANQLSVYSWSI
jgi:hypothetical protein